MLAGAHSVTAAGLAQLAWSRPATVLPRTLVTLAQLLVGAAAHNAVGAAGAAADALLQAPIVHPQPNVTPAHPTLPADAAVAAAAAADSAAADSAAAGVGAADLAAQAENGGGHCLFAAEPAGCARGLAGPPGGCAHLASAAGGDAAALCDGRHTLQELLQPAGTRQRCCYASH